MNFKRIKIDLTINISIYKLLKPLSKLKLTKFYTNQVLRTAIYWQDLKPLAPKEADLKEKSHEIS